MNRMLESKYKGFKLALAGAVLTTGLTTPPDVGEPPKSVESITADANACGVDGIPITPDNFLCKDRRTGTLGVVVVPDLKVKDPFIAYDKKSVLEAATYATDTLREVTDGIIDLKPQIIYAPKKVEEEIRTHNVGYKDGRECTDLYDGQNMMGQVIKKYMPETTKLANVVVFGGDACANGFINMYGLSGYEETKRYADVYNSDARLDPLIGSSFINKVGGLMAHEVSHNLGFNHAGNIDLLYEKQLMADTVKEVNIPKILMENKIIMKKKHYVFLNQYGEQGNIMSSKVFPLFKNGPYKPQSLTNALQQEYTTKYSQEKGTSAHKNVLQPLLPNEQLVIKDNDTSPKGITVPLSSLGLEIDKFKFTTISFEPVFTNGHAFLNATLSTEGQDLLLTTATMGKFAISSEKPRIFTTETSLLSAQQGVGNEVIFKVEPLI